MSTLEQIYDAAVGKCLHAALDLRALNGEAAIGNLQAAIRLIERAQTEAAREERMATWRTARAPTPGGVS